MYNVTITFNVNGQVISHNEKDITLLSDSIDLIKARFNFSPEWQEYTKTAIFKSDTKKPYSRILVDGVCMVPPEAIKKSKYMSVSVFGVSGTQLITATDQIVPLTPSGYTDDSIVSPAPTENIYQQIVTLMQRQAVDAVHAETAQGKAEEARDDAKGYAEQTALDRTATGADRTAVNAALTGFAETTLPDAIQAVEDKADTEIARVGQAGDTQVQAVNAAGAEAKQYVDQSTIGFASTVNSAENYIAQIGVQQQNAVKSEGDAQVLAVQNKGIEAIGLVDAKKTVADQSAADAQQSAADATLAKAQAQAAAGQTAQDKTATAADRQAVAQDKQAVNTDKQTIAQTVVSFGATVTEAEQEITAEGTTQVGNVQTAGTAQIGAVQAAGTEVIAAAGQSAADAAASAGAAHTSEVNAASSETQAEQSKTAAQQAQQECAADKIAAEAAKAEAENAAAAALGCLAQIDIKAIETYYAMRRTGKVYQTKIWKFAANPTSAGEKLLDNAGLNFTPSTDTVEGVDDYANIPLFDWCNVNYVREADGSPVPTAIEGSDGFKTSGAVDVGAMQMSFWWCWDATNPDYDLITISDLPHAELGLEPWPECVKLDGTVMPWCIGSKYWSGVAGDGLLRSQPNLALKNFMSHNSTIAEYQRKGAGYWGAGSIRNTFQIVFNAIKGGTKNSQTLFAGCTSYDAQRKVARAEVGVRRVLLTTAQGAAFVIGSTVSIGDHAENTSLDRGQSYMRNIADLASIASIDTVTIDGTDYAALNLEFAADITTTATTYVSTMPWHAGSTDAVKGRHDGSPGSNADGKHVYRVQGREYAPGAYFVSADTVMDFQPDFSKNVYVAQKGTPHSVADATIKSTYKLIGNIPAEAAGADYWVGDVALDADTGAWYPSAVGASSAQGMGDRLYAGGTATSGTRGYLQGGDLGFGSGAGSAFLNCRYGLDWAYWNCAGCD